EALLCFEEQKKIGNQKYQTRKSQAITNKIQEYKNTYIYVPTWRKAQNRFIPPPELEWEKINTQIKKNQSLLLVKLHPYTEACKEKDNNNLSNIIFLESDIDIYEILPQTDTLITDYSSVYFDYILLKSKKIILFPHGDKQHKQYARELSYSYEKLMPG